MKISKSIFILMLLGLSFAFIHCKKEKGDLIPPEVETGYYFPATKIATGKIKRIGPGIEQHGHVIGITPFPELDRSIQEFTTMKGEISDPNDTIAINSEFAQLSSDTTYYIRAYVVDVFGNDFYGENREIVVDPNSFTEACFISDKDRCELGDCLINFDAGCSINATSYRWDFDGDGVAEKEGPDEKAVEYNYTTRGAKTVVLTTVTATGEADNTFQTIHVYGIGTSLVPCFITDTTECYVDNCTINFDASCSFNATNYKWDFDNDGQFELSGTDKEVVDYTYTSDGIFTVKLEAEGLDGDSDTVTTIIKVNESLTGLSNPEACFTASDTTCEASCTVFFDASCSFDDIINYRWDFTGDGTFQLQGSDEVLASHTYMQAGAYDATLVVEKENGLTDTTTLSVVVTDTEALPPTACFSISPETAEVGQTVTFDASCSENIITYRWDFNNDGIFDTGGADKEIVEYTYYTPIPHTIKLQVENPNGEDETTDMVIITEAISEQPDACFAANTQTVEVGEIVTFDASCSENAITYRWDFDCDGVFEMGGSGEEIVSHAYDAPGSYIAKLQVENVYGLDTMEISITVNDATGDEPIACFNASTQMVEVGEIVSFDASCSENAVTYRWDFDGDGVFNTGGENK